MDQDVAMVFIAVILEVFHWFLLYAGGQVHFDNATGLDSWFVTNWGRKGALEASKVTQLISNLILM
jgi:hypothetical protein